MKSKNKGVYRYRVPIEMIRTRRWVRKSRWLTLALEAFIQRRINEELATIQSQ